MGSSGGFAEALPYGAGGSARIRLYRRLLLDHGDRTQQYTVVGFRIPSVETKNHAKPVTQVAEGPVSSKPVSGPNSLLSGKRTGNFVKLGPGDRTSEPDSRVIPGS